MIVDETKNEVYKSKSKESQGFTMKSSAHAFRILSDGLYQYKVRAVIREYLCNAYDSHKMSGNLDVDIKVHIPTLLEPWFEVQDQGLGLSKDEIKSIYTVYFESTKSKTNDAIGCLGLGSKSAFAVSDQFTVTSCKDGVKCTYICYINENGTPDADLKYEGETEERNGVTIRIPVDLSEGNLWEKETSYVLASFPKINYFNASQRLDLLFEEELEEHWQSCEEALDKGSYLNIDPVQSRCVVIMGNVAYSVENWTQYIPEFHPFKAIFKDNLSGASMYLRAEMGEVDFNPNRETLNITPKTFKFLRQSFVKIINEKYREQVEDSDIFSSYYLTYVNFKDTPLWTFITSIKLPCAPFRLDYYDLGLTPYLYKGSFLPFEDKTKETISAITYGNSGSPYVYTNDIEKLKAISITNLAFDKSRGKGGEVAILFAENGRKKPKAILDKYKKESKSVNNAIFYCSTQEDLEMLKTYFNVDTYEIAEDYLEETKRKPRAKRQGYGKLDDTKILGWYHDSVTGDTKLYGVVDTENTNCMYIDPEKVVSYNFRKMLRFFDNPTVILKDKNNKGKIERVGLENFEVALKEKFKGDLDIWLDHKIKLYPFYSVQDLCFMQDNFVTRILASRDATFKRLKQKAVEAQRVYDYSDIKNLNEYDLEMVFGAKFLTKRSKAATFNKEKREAILKRVQEKAEPYLLAHRLEGSDFELMRHYLKLAKFKFTEEEERLYAN